MTEHPTPTKTFEEVFVAVPAKELLLVSAFVSVLFAISGMDFIGYFIYLFTRTSKTELYSRSLLNVLLGFLFTTISLLLIPIVINQTRWKKPLKYFGTQFGEKKLGLIIVLAFLVFTPLFYFSSNNQQLINTYPMSKDVLGSWWTFVLYELAYVLLYYVPYEFFFRGVLQLGLSNGRWKKWQSIAYVTALTTFLHLTKPWTEIVAALVAGILFGIIAEKTKSWYYVFMIHILTGVLTDTFCALRFLEII